MRESAFEKVTHKVHKVSCSPNTVSSVAQVVSNSFRPYGLQNASLPCPLPTPGACSNSCPSSWWCNPTISSSVIPFSSRLQSCPASGSFLMSWLFTSGGQSIGVSASASVLPMNIQGWFPLGWTGLISLLFKELSRVFLTARERRVDWERADLNVDKSFSGMLGHAAWLWKSEREWR